MFGPYPLSLSTVDPIEERRIQSGRPASRAEILGRHERELKIDHVRTNHDVDASTIRADRSARYRDADTSTLPGLDHARRLISRFLMSAAQRIKPEAA